MKTFIQSIIGMIHPCTGNQAARTGLPPATSKKGFALVLVVTSLVLMTIMAVSFLLSTGTDLANVRAYARTLESRRNADLAVNVALSLMTAATSQSTANDPVAWASQPGMIRTWKDNGSLHNVYRLYSSNYPIQAGGSFNPNEDASDLASWKSGAPNRDYNAIWCDLNSPLESGNQRIYPIMPPLSTQDANAGVDPATISGFEINNPPGFSPGSPSSVNNPAPMPVRWMYVLKDGSLVPGSGSNMSASLSGATHDNPPVARIAFWTDDETSKVNINTASEGHYWDYPITNSLSEGEWGQKQPIQNEFQRYPGHPANVSLSAVINNGSINTSTDGIYKFAPRVQHGGSKGGTQNTTSLFLSAQIHLNNDLSRLFATTQEMAFRPDDSGSSLGNRISNRDLFGIGSDATFAKLVQNREFFLTTHSRASELNVFDLPRVSMWPITTDSRTTSNITGTRMDTFDKTIVSSSKLGGYEYFYRRANNYSSSFDYANIQRNQQIYAYLRRLMGNKIPGFGGDFVAKYTPADVDALNTQLFDWIRSGPNLYGFGKASEERAQSGGNSLSVNKGYAATRDGIDTHDVLGGSYSFPYGSNLGLVVPIRINAGSGDTKGTGSAFIFTEGGYHLVCEKMELDQPSTGRVRYTFRPLVYIETAALKPDVLGAFGRMIQRKEKYQLFLRFNGSDLQFSPVSGAGGTVQNAGFDMGKFIYYARSNPTTGAVGTQLVAMSPAWWFSGNSTSNYSEQTQTGNSLPFVGNPISFDFSNVLNLTDLNLERTQEPHPTWKVRVSRMDWTFELGFARSAGDKIILHQGQFIIPEQDVPIPYFSSNDSNLYTSSSNSIMAESSMLKRMQVDPKNYQLLGGDVIRTAEITGPSGSPSRGDWRLVALNPSNMDDTWFAPVDDPDNPVLPSPKKRLFAANFSESDYWSLNRLFYYNLRLAAGIDLNLDQGAKTTPPFASFNLDRNNGAIMSNGQPGDYVMNFPGMHQHDGALFEYPVEHHIGQEYSTGGRWPYFNDSIEGNNSVGGYTFDVLQFTLLYSPNRQVYSPFQMGSLLTQAPSRRPWQTLLFTAMPAGAGGSGNDPATATDHPGAATPPDHLIADLFWMPRVDPLPISENQSSLGKINLNVAIEPFRSYITRDTALHAALKFIKLRAIHNDDVNKRHRRAIAPNESPGDSLSNPTIYDLDVDKTVAGIWSRFINNDIYRTATEIATLPLFPTGIGGLRQWWYNHRYTGDNIRERPYGYLQALLTTKSNTYRIHWRVQTLAKVAGTDSNKWEEGRDQVVSEYRGSTLVERYLDASDTGIPDYATNTSVKPLHEFYRWRIISNTQFNP